MSPAEPRSLAEVIEQECRDRSTGAVVVGSRQAFLYILFGQAMHATSAELNLRGLEAVEHMGRIAAAGGNVAFLSDETSGVGKTLRGIPLAQILQAVKRGEGGSVTATTEVEPVETVRAPNTTDIGAPPAPVRAPDSSQAAEAPVSAAETPAAEAGREPLEPVQPTEDPSVAPAIRAGQTEVEKATQRSAVGEGRPTKRRPTAVPPPIPAVALAEVEAKSADVDGLVSGTSSTQLVLHGARLAGIALLDHGQVHDAIYQETDNRPLFGRAAYRAMAHSFTGVLTVSTIPKEAFDLLPLIWRGQPQFSDVDASTIDMDALGEELLATGHPAGLVVKSPDETVVVLIDGGEVSVCYSTDGSHDLHNDAALKRAAAAPGATVSVLSDDQDAIVEEASVADDQAPSAETEQVQSNDPTPAVLPPYGAPAEVIDGEEGQASLVHPEALVPDDTSDDAWAGPEGEVDTDADAQLFDAGRRPPSALLEPHPTHDEVLAADPEPAASKDDGSLRQPPVEEWEEALRDMVLVVKSRLHRHSKVAVAELESSERSLKGFLATAERLRTMKPRAIAPEVMEEIAHRVELIARERVG